jgi:hypothetical protein
MAIAEPQPRPPSIRERIASFKLVAGLAAAVTLAGCGVDIPRFDEGRDESKPTLADFSSALASGAIEGSPEGVEGYLYDEPFLDEGGVATAVFGQPINTGESTPSEDVVVEDLTEFNQAEEAEAEVDDFGGDSITSLIVDRVDEPDFSARPSIKINDPPGGPHQQSHCLGGMTEGADALGKYIEERWSPPVTRAATQNYACRPIRGGSSTTVHAEGRAVDAMIPGETEEGLRVGNEIRNFLIHNAEILGIQRVIWNRGIWQANIDGWNDYYGLSPHTDHLHIELNDEGSTDEMAEIFLALIVQLELAA